MDENSDRAASHRLALDIADLRARFEETRRIFAPEFYVTTVELRVRLEELKVWVDPNRFVTRELYNQRHEDVKAVQDRILTRLGVVESRQSITIGVGITMVAIATIVGVVLGHIFFGK